MLMQSLTPDAYPLLPNVPSCMLCSAWLPWRACLEEMDVIVRQRPE